MVEQKYAAGHRCLLDGPGQQGPAQLLGGEGGSTSDGADALAGLGKFNINVNAVPGDRAPR